MTPAPGEEAQDGARTSSTSDVGSIDIRPEVSVLGVFRHLNYRPWFAAAEFVDNAIQSFQDHQRELNHVAGNTAELLVNVKIDTSDEGFIQVSDNAAGIYRDEWGTCTPPRRPSSRHIWAGRVWDGNEDGGCMVRTPAHGALHGPRRACPSRGHTRFQRDCRTEA